MKHRYSFRKMVSFHLERNAFLIVEHQGAFFVYTFYTKKNGVSYLSAQCNFIFPVQTFEPSNKKVSPLKSTELER